MSEQYLGEIRAVSFNFAPKGWALCNGQTMPINQYAALFSLLGTTYGGNGTTTFNLPNLQGRTPVHFGSGASGNQVSLGQVGGAESVTLNGNQSPHTHLVAAQSSGGNSNTPSGNLPGASTSPVQAYGATPNTPMNAAMVGPAGGSQPHNNIQPSLVVNYIIALTGIFPSRN
jgi:microcystin-dependent protein